MNNKETFLNKFDDNFYSFSDVRILLLVRDPRGTMASRSHRDWCPKNPDCDQPEQLCQDLVEDYMVSKELMEKYPNRIK